MGSTVHGVAKSRTDWVTFTCTYLCENTSDSTDEGISPTRLLPPPTPDATCKFMLSPVILTHQLLIQSSGNTLLRFNLFNLLEGFVHACLRSRFSSVQLFATPWTVAHKAPLSLWFSRQDYCSGMLFPSPGEGLIDLRKAVCLPFTVCYKRRW